MGFLVQTGLFLGSGLVRKFVLGSNQIVQFILFSERASNPTFLHVLIFFHRQTYKHTDIQTDRPTKVGLEAPRPELKNCGKLCFVYLYDFTLYQILNKKAEYAQLTRNTACGAKLLPFVFVNIFCWTVWEFVPCFEISLFPYI